VKFAFISAEKAWAPVSVLCRVLEVTRSGFYAWQARDPSEQAIDDQKLAVEIAAIHKASGETYGSPRVHAELHAKGLEVSRKRVARLMRELGIKSRRKRRFKATPTPGTSCPLLTTSGPEVRGRCPRRRLGHRHHLRLDRRGLAVPRRDPRPVLAARGRTRHERAHRSRPRPASPA